MRVRYQHHVGAEIVERGYIRRGCSVNPSAQDALKYDALTHCDSSRGGWAEVIDPKGKVLAAHPYPRARALGVPSSSSTGA